MSKAVTLRVQAMEYDNLLVANGTHTAAAYRKDFAAAVLAPVQDLAQQLELDGVDLKAAKVKLADLLEAMKENKKLKLPPKVG